MSQLGGKPFDLPYLLVVKLHTILFELLQLLNPLTHLLLDCARTLYHLADFLGLPARLAQSRVGRLLLQLFLR